MSRRTEPPLATALLRVSGSSQRSLKRDRLHLNNKFSYKSRGKSQVSFLGLLVKQVIFVQMHPSAPSAFSFCLPEERKERALTLSSCYDMDSRLNRVVTTRDAQSSALGVCHQTRATRIKTLRRDDTTRTKTCTGSKGAQSTPRLTLLSCGEGQRHTT